MKRSTAKISDNNSAEHNNELIRAIKIALKFTVSQAKKIANARSVKQQFDVFPEEIFAPFKTFIEEPRAKTLPIRHYILHALNAYPKAPRQLWEHLFNLVAEFPLDPSHENETIYRTLLTINRQLPSGRRKHLAHADWVLINLLDHPQAVKVLSHKHSVYLDKVYKQMTVYDELRYHNSHEAHLFASSVPIAAINTASDLVSWSFKTALSAPSALNTAIHDVRNSYNALCSYYKLSTAMRSCDWTKFKEAVHEGAEPPVAYLNQAIAYQKSLLGIILDLLEKEPSLRPPELIQRSIHGSQYEVLSSVFKNMEHSELSPIVLSYAAAHSTSIRSHSSDPSLGDSVRPSASSGDEGSTALRFESGYSSDEHVSTLYEDRSDNDQSEVLLESATKALSQRPSTLSRLMILPIRLPFLAAKTTIRGIENLASHAINVLARRALHLFDDETFHSLLPYLSLNEFKIENKDPLKWAMDKEANAKGIIEELLAQSKRKKYPEEITRIGQKAFVVKFDSHRNGVGIISYSPDSDPNEVNALTMTKS